MEENILDEKLEDIKGFTIRALTLFKAGDVETVRDLIQLSTSDILRFSNSGINTLKNIDDTLSTLGFKRKDAVIKVDTIKSFRWFKRQLYNENAVLIWLNILDKEHKVTPNRIKVVGLTVYFYNNKEV